MTASTLSLRWAGGAVRSVRNAPAEAEAEEVRVGSGATGWVLPDDVDPPEREPEPWAALLPVLDPTVMG